MRRSTVVIGLFACALTGALDARAQEPAIGGIRPDAAQVSDDGSPVVIRQTELDRQVKALASQIRCVVCRGQSIQESPSELAQEMRGVVREQLIAGRTPDEIRAYFVERYGQQVLLDPEPRGVNLLVYVLPVVVLLGGAAFVFTKARALVAAPVRDADDREPQHVA